MFTMMVIAMGAVGLAWVKVRRHRKATGGGASR
jgi:hypothetical protein